MNHKFCKTHRKGIEEMIKLIHGETPFKVEAAEMDRRLRAVLAERPYVRIPFMVKMVPALRAVLPHRAFNAVAAILGGQDVMANWTGPSERAGLPSR